MSALPGPGVKKEIFKSKFDMIWTLISLMFESHKSVQRTWSVASLISWNNYFVLSDFFCAQGISSHSSVGRKPLIKKLISKKSLAAIISNNDSLTFALTLISISLNRLFAAQKQCSQNYLSSLLIID